MRTPTILTLAAAAATTVVALRDPHQGGYGMCPVLGLTGWYCPTCGGLRAVHDLAGGDVLGAWAMNPLVTIAVPLTAAAFVIWTIRAWRGVRARAIPIWPVYVIVGLFLVFTVLRNLAPLAPYLAPHLA